MRKTEKRTGRNVTIERKKERKTTAEPTNSQKKKENGECTGPTLESKPRNMTTVNKALSLKFNNIERPESMAIETLRSNLDDGRTANRLNEDTKT